MDKRPRKQAKGTSTNSEEVSSIEWEFINMTEQEEDLSQQDVQIGWRQVGFNSRPDSWAKS
ncbi:hypothetical protein L1049_022623 [Liquidambar formosana]|uniref:Uncharacterized protein n=1 Tax=Liquidambar formosana TaxID=63359 RepID=A0AAP0RCQ4_LIQFO